MSERDGWRHLYLYDLNGTLIRRLTEGAFPVLRVVTVDERAGWVYFTAHADKQRPYDTHLYRVSLEGKEFTRLTDAKERHDVQVAPSKEFFIDTHSSVGRPVAVELMSADGTFLRTLSKADIDALIKELKWSPPEEFVVKAADGKTDLYGVLYKPYDFDPNKKYPVIEVIYGAAAEVPHTFTHPHGVDFHAEHAQALAQLGFIAFQVDNRHLGKRAGKEVLERNPWQHRPTRNTRSCGYARTVGRKTPLHGSEPGGHIRPFMGRVLHHSHSVACPRCLSRRYCQRSGAAGAIGPPRALAHGGDGGLTPQQQGEI